MVVLLCLPPYLLLTPFYSLPPYLCLLIPASYALPSTPCPLLPAPFSEHCPPADDTLGLLAAAAEQETQGEEEAGSQDPSLKKKWSLIEGLLLGVFFMGLLLRVC